MEQRQVSMSEDKIQKVNSSMIAFRELIESLRVKNQHLIKPSTSELNPEACSSSQSRVCNSERAIINDEKIKVVSNIDSIVIPPAPSVSTPALPIEDEGIRLKARGHVAGRDIINKKPTVLPSSKFNETVLNNKELARNKNLDLTNSFANEKDSQLPSIENIKLLMKRNGSNKQDQAEPKSDMSGETFAETSRSFLTKAMATTPLNKPKFQQNRLNFKAIATRNKIKDIEQDIVIKFCKQARQLRNSCQANQIFEYFEGLMEKCNVAIISPFIKKFKNCIYFGQPISQDETYEGFLYFYQSKIYYGEFLRNQKNGKGVEIFIQDQIIYKGIFKEGQKSGKFYIKKPDEIYIGFLEKGEYHGQGKLQTRESVYQGQFENGQKQGFGQELYPKTGVRMIGYFDRGVFSKRSKSSFSHSQIEKGIKLKVPNPKRSNGKNFSSTSRLPSDQVEGTYGNFKERNTGQTELGLYTPPFSSSMNQFAGRKAPFNKQKMRSFLPGMSNHKFIDPMPENCRDFDYSFDVSSRKDTEQFSQLGKMSGRNKLFHEKQRKGVMLHFSQIQQENQHLDTSAIQQPLPVPCFFK